MVNGWTSILLDSNSKDVQEEVYTVIRAVLLKPEFLASFAPSVARAQYIKSIDNTLVFFSNKSSPENGNTTPSSVTATIAVAAASVSFVVASIFCYGLLRRDMRNHPEPHIRHKNRRIAKGGIGRSGNVPVLVGNPIGIRSRPERSFVRLEDFATSPAGHTTIITTCTPPQEGEDQPYEPSITWSISDITSDSASIRSNLSRRTSNLERIEEEDEESDNTDRSIESSDREYTLDDDGFDADQSSAEFHHGSVGHIDQHSPPRLSRLYGFVTSPIRFTSENFFQDPRPADLSDLQGCQFLDEEDGRHSPIVPSMHVMPDVDDDLQVSLDTDDDVGHDYEDTRHLQIPSLLGPNDEVNDDSLRWNPSPSASLNQDKIKEVRSGRRDCEQEASGAGEAASTAERVTNQDDPEDDVSEDTTIAVADIQEEEEKIVHLDRDSPKDILPCVSEDDIELGSTPKASNESDANNGNDVDFREAANYVSQTTDVQPKDLSVSDMAGTPKQETSLVSDDDNDSDDERPWIGIAHGEAIVTIEKEEYFDEYLSSCPETPCSDEGGYTTTTTSEYFQTPRQYESATDDRDEI